MLARIVVGLSALACTASLPAAQAQVSESFVVERMHTVARFENEGTGIVDRTTRVRLQDAAAVSAFGQLVFGYQAVTERLTPTVRIIRPGGEVVSVSSDAFQELTGPVARVAPVYSDDRQIHVTVPGLRLGDVLEFQTVTTVHTPLAAGEFFFDYRFVRDAVVWEEILEVDVPARRDVTVATRDGSEPPVITAGGRKTYRWRRQRFAPDPDTTGTVTPPDVSLSSFRSWADVGRWYVGLQRDRVTPSEAVARKAREVTQGLGDHEARVRALYEYVKRNVRYVSLSFGIGRFQPHAAGDVLSNAYGDCKDKHTLLAALLAAEGITAYPALVNSWHEIDPQVPSPTQFDHLITVVALGDTLLWLDATSELTPFAYLTADLRGNPALVVRTDLEPVLLDVPRDPPFQSSYAIHVDGVLASSRILSGSVALEVRGDREFFLRAGYHGTPRNQWESLSGAILEQLELPWDVTSVTAVEPMDTERPFRLDLTVADVDHLTVSGDLARYKAPLPRFRLSADDFETNPDGSLEMGSPIDYRMTAQIQLPAGVRATPPASVRVSRDYAGYESSYAVRGDTLRVDRTLWLLGGTLPAARRLDYQAFARAVGSDEAQEFQIEWSPTTREIAQVSGADDLHAAGHAALERDDFDEAIRLLRQVVETDPQHAWGWNNLGRAYLGRNDLEEAIDAFRRQLEVNPFDEYANNNLGLVYWRQRRWEEAVEAFQRQIEITPLDQYANANLGRLLNFLKRHDEALGPLRTALTVKPDDDALHAEMAEALFNVTDGARSDEALVHLERSVKLAGTPQAMNNAAYVLAERGVHLDRAEEWVRAALGALTDSLGRVPRESTSVAAFGPALRTVVSLAHYWDTLGWILWRQGAVERARDYIEPAWHLTWDPVIGEHLGQIYEGLGREDEAAKTYALVVAGAQPFPDGSAVEMAKERLEEMVGAGRAKGMIDAARPDASALRVIRLTDGPKLDVEGTVLVLVGASGEVQDARVLEGSGLGALIPALRKRTFPRLVPSDAGVIIPRVLSVTCSADTGRCDAIFVDTVRAP